MKLITILMLVLLPTLALHASAQETKHLELFADGISMLELTCGAGALKIRGVDGLDSIRVTAQFEGKDLKQDELEDHVEKNVRLNLTRGNTKAFLLSEIEPQFKDRMDARLNITVEIPRKLDLKISDGSGPIKVSDLIGNLIIDDDSGKIEVENITGNLMIADGSGSIFIDNVKGTVKVKDGSGLIEIDDIRGDVFISDGSGDMIIRHVDGNVNVADDSGDIDISDVSQNVFIRESQSGELNIERVKGKVTIRE